MDSPLPTRDTAVVEANAGGIADITAAALAPELRGEALARFSAVLKPFFELSGSRADVRAAWLERYHEVTPSFAQAMAADGGP